MAPGDKKNNPIEFFDTSEDEQGRVTTDSGIPSLDGLLSDIPRPTTSGATRSSLSSSPTKRPSISASKGKERARNQIYPLPNPSGNHGRDSSDDDVKPGIAGSSSSARRRSSKTSSPVKRADPHGTPRAQNRNISTSQAQTMVSLSPEPANAAASSSQTTTSLAPASQYASGSWENPVPYDSLSQAGPSRLPKSATQTPTSAKTPGTKPKHPPGSWENPAPYNPSPRSPTSNSSAGPHSRPSSSAPAHPPGSWENPAPYQPSSARPPTSSSSSSAKPVKISSSQPALGSWENPEPYKASLKRRPSPPSPRYETTSAKSKGKSRRISENIAATLPASNEEASSPQVLASAAQSQRRLGPKWATSSKSVTPQPPPLPAGAGIARPVFANQVLQNAIESIRDSPIADPVEVLDGSDLPEAPLEDPTILTETPNDSMEVDEPHISDQQVQEHDQPPPVEEIQPLPVGGLELSPDIPSLDPTNSDDDIALLEELNKSGDSDSDIIAELENMPVDVPVSNTEDDVAEEHQGEPLPALPDSRISTSPPTLDVGVEDVREGVADVEITELSAVPSTAASPAPSSAPSIEEIQSDAFTPKAGNEARVIGSGITKQDALEHIRAQHSKPPVRRNSARLKRNVHRVSSDGPEVAEQGVLPASQNGHSTDENMTPPLTSVDIVGPSRYKDTTREQFRELVEDEGDVEALLDTDEESGPSTGRSLVPAKMEDQLFFSIDGQPDDSTQQPPEDRRGEAKREFNCAQIDEWNRRAPYLTRNPPLHRTIFEAIIAEKELASGGITIANEVDEEGAPPELEFEYSNEMLYHSDVPDPELSLGCDCEGPCDPNSRTCSCLKRQQAYSYGIQMGGFAYDEPGHAKNLSIPIWECSETCGCPPSCMNRVIQHGRSPKTKLEIFKTVKKGWGVRAKGPIEAGTFIGLYAGELITEEESEKRGVLYAEIGRTYIFDIDGYQISNPPESLEKIDMRLAEIAAATAKRAKIARGDDDPDGPYNAYSVDAFHYGNYTRFFNHSCDPNLEITQAYVKDFHPERPLLVIFSRRPVAKNEELCISYKGIPDESQVEAPIIEDKKSTNGKRKGKKSRTKTSASAHITHNKESQDKQSSNRCFCGARNCDGKMFNL